VEFQKLKEKTRIPFLVGNHFFSHAKSPKFIGRLMHRQTISSTGAKLHDKHARVAKIPKAFKLLDRPLIPPHQKYTKRKPVGHNNKIHVLGACLRPLEASHIYVRSKRFPKSCNENHKLTMIFYVPKRTAFPETSFSKECETEMNLPVMRS
jgi:hypothetical protein